MLPQRPPATPAGRKSGPITYPQATFETVKRRVLARLEERLDMSASKRMPQSLLRQSLRQHASDVTETEARALSKADRDRIVEDVLAELLGYGPLEELFADAGVREIMVTGPAAVIARRDQGQWLPTSVKFRDEDHVRSVLDKIATHADAAGPVMTSVAVFDMKLPNGFRAIAVIPPAGLDHPATAAFVRERASPALPGAKDSASAATAGPATSSASGGTQKPPGSVSIAPRAPGSGLVDTPPPRTGPAEPAVPVPPAHDPLSRYRNRILERLLTKSASLGLYDVSRLDVNDLRKVISAYIGEYATAEKIYLSDTDQGRLTLEILTALRK